MSALVPFVKSDLEATAARMQLQWLDFPGPWLQYHQAVLHHNDPLELQVLEMWPAEFESATAARMDRLRSWEDNQLSGLLAKMMSLTEAEKAVTVRDSEGGSSVEYVPDVTAQLSATKYMIDRILGRPKDPPTEDGDDDQADGVETSEERKALIKLMRNTKGVRLSERRAEQSVEFISGVDRDADILGYD